MKDEKGNVDRLNKKLAEWAGMSIKHDFKPIGFDNMKECSKCGIGKEMNLYKYCNLPNFTESLDACFKWLVPKLGFFKYGGAHPFRVKLLSGWGDTQGEYGVEITNPTHWAEGYNTSRYAVEFNKNPALALCLAIEKLIDKEA